MNRCLNDVFGYCIGEQDPIEAQSYKLELDYRGLTHKVPANIVVCTHDYRTCPYHRIFTETYTPRDIRQHCQPLS